ncbi:hypothetical protein C4J81_17585 [Deltaproteobacteria bacterium Smac51]|nr:hypothetical protein C4J81_17585 [Deltaproteobacteria bacterium Smac51]
MIDIKHSIQSLGNKRKIFHSEADFQFSLAWEIQRLHPSANIRLEYCPVCAPRRHIDILLELNKRKYPIELKYKTLKTTVTDCDELFNLKNHGAQTIGKYDLLADIERIESLSESLPGFEEGYAVWLTNDPIYWQSPSRENTIAGVFPVHNGAVAHREMPWAPQTAMGTKKGRDKSIVLKGRYAIQWEDFSEVHMERNGSFKYALIKVQSTL